MRFTLSLSPLLAAGLLFASLPQVSAEDGLVLKFLQSIPSCAVTCLVAELPSTDCSPTDMDCICKDSKLLDKATACALASCTVKESLVTRNLTDRNCGFPIRDTSASIVNTTIIFGVITSVLVAVRIAFKYSVSPGHLGTDDWLIILAQIFSIITQIIIIHGTVATGLGKDVWKIPFDQITEFGRFFYVQEPIYFLLVTLLKMSFLFFYLRIFPTVLMRRVIWRSIIFNTLFGAAFVLAAIFQCQPVSYFWTRWDEESTEGTCISINGLAWANAIGSIVLDLWMLGIPLSQLPSLQLHWKRKLGVGLMFCVGILITIVSILRLQSLVNFATSVNSTWDNGPVTTWSILEINVGMICACMPALRLMLARAFRIFRETTNDINSGAKVNSAYFSGNMALSGGRGVSHSRAVASRASVEPGAGGVLYKKSYTIQYSDHDEASLVQLRDLGTAGEGREASTADSRVRRGSEISGGFCEDIDKTNN